MLWEREEAADGLTEKTKFTKEICRFGLVIHITRQSSVKQSSDFTHCYLPNAAYPADFLDKIHCFTKQAQPDFKGALCDGSCIIFDAKHTEKDRIQQNVITETQWETFDRPLPLP